MKLSFGSEFALLPSGQEQMAQFLKESEWMDGLVDGSKGRGVDFIMLKGDLEKGGIKRERY